MPIAEDRNVLRERAARRGGGAGAGTAALVVLDPFHSVAAEYVGAKTEFSAVGHV